MAERKPELDLLRGIAAVLMVEQHLGIWLIDAMSYVRGLGAVWIGLNLLGGLAAPLFIFVAGASSFSGRGNAMTASLRGVKLVGLGYLLNCLVPSWFEPWSFYVLHLLGAWLIISPWCRRLRSSALLALAVLFIGLAAGAQTYLRVPRDISNEWMSTLRGPAGVLRLALVEGHFPVFPWMALALVGAATVALSENRNTRTRFGLRYPGLFVAFLLPALGLLTAAEMRPRWAIKAATRPFFAFNFYPATVAFCLLLIAACILCLDLARFIKADGALTRGLVLFGRTSLSLMFAHIVIFREILPRLGIFHVCGPMLTLVIIIGTLVSWYGFTRIWERHDFRFGLEWLLRLGETDARRH